MKSFVSFLFRHFAFVLMAGIAIAVYALLQSNSGFYEKSRDSS